MVRNSLNWKKLDSCFAKFIVQTHSSTAVLFAASFITGPWSSHRGLQSVSKRNQSNSLVLRADDEAEKNSDNAQTQRQQQQQQQQQREQHGERRGGPAPSLAAGGHGDQDARVAGGEAMEWRTAGPPVVGGERPAVRSQVESRRPSGIHH